MSRKSVSKFVNRWSRKLHRWGAILIALPILIVICTGLLLLVKKDIAWLQPSTMPGSGTVPSISFDTILAVVAAVPETEITSWDDVDRLDVRPATGIVKVRSKNRWEVQVDTATGEVMQVAFRRSDLIESIHDGTWFHAKAKLWVFLPAGAILLTMWFSGMYLWILPIRAKRQGRARQSTGT